jgi:hypothetical protein
VVHPNLLISFRRGGAGPAPPPETVT